MDMKRFSLFIVIIFFTQWICSQTWDDKDLNKILTLINTQKYDKVNNKLKEIKSHINRRNLYEQIEIFSLCGYSCIQSGDYLSAISELENAMKIIYENKIYDSKIHLKVAYLMADAYSRLKQYKEAESIINIALARCTGNWQESAYAKLLYNLLSKVYKEQNGNSFIIAQVEKESQSISDNFNVSTEEYKFKENNDSDSVQDTIINGVPIQKYIYGELTKALTYTNNGDWDLSIKTLDKIELALCEKGLQHNPLTRSLYAQRARLYLTLGNIHKAHDELLNAKRIFEKVDDCTSIEYANCINSIGIVYQELGLLYYSTLMFNLAKAIIEGIMKTRKDLDYYSAYLACYDNLARNYYEMGDVEEAFQTWDRIISLAQKEEYEDELFSSTINYAYAKMQLGDYKSGAERLSNLMKNNHGYVLKDGGYQNLLLCLYFDKDKDLLIKTLNEYIAYSKSNLKTILLSFSENERNAYWEEKSLVLQMIANATCWKYPTSETKKIAYNTVLYTKGLAAKLPNLIMNFAKQNNSGRR